MNIGSTEMALQLKKCFTGFAEKKYIDLDIDQLYKENDNYFKKI